MSYSSATQQQNVWPQSTKGKLLRPTNSNISQLIHSKVGAHRRSPFEDEEETSSSHSEESSSDENPNRYFLFVLYFVRYLFICIFY